MNAATATRSPDFDITGTDVPRDTWPEGRIRFTLGVLPTYKGRASMVKQRRERLNDLRTWGAWDVLKAIQDDVLEVGEVCRRIKRGGEPALAEIRRDLDKTRVGGVPTFKAEAERFLKWYESNREPLSLQQRKSQLTQFGRQHRFTDVTLIDDAAFDQVTKADVEGALAAIAGAANTRENIRTAVSALYTWSIKDESERARVGGRAVRWSVNPASLVASTPQTGRVATASKAQVQALLAASEPYQEAYLRAFLHLGLRAGELIHTRLHLDLDLETWLWRIQKRGTDRRCGCKQCHGNGWSPKTRRSHRELLVPAHAEGPPVGTHPLRASIENYLERYPAAAGDFVFRNPRTQTIWGHRSLADDFAALCKRAGVGYGRGEAGTITLHSCRHTCITDLVRAGVRESVIAAIAGDTISTITKVYVHLNAQDLANGIARGSVYL